MSVRDGQHFFLLLLFFLSQDASSLDNTRNRPQLGCYSKYSSLLNCGSDLLCLGTVCQLSLPYRFSKESICKLVWQHVAYCGLIILHGLKFSFLSLYDNMHGWLKKKKSFDFVVLGHSNTLSYLTCCHGLNMCEEKHLHIRSRSKCGIHCELFITFKEFILIHPHHASVHIITNVTWGEWANQFEAFKPTLNVEVHCWNRQYILIVVIRPKTH